MKTRIRFTKKGNTKYVGHLDTMRFFQRLMRRAGADVAYTEGFSPHQKMTFAAPLSLGMTSSGEYLDVEMNSVKSSAEMVDLLNDKSIPEIKIMSFKLLHDGSKNAMSSLDAADYMIECSDFSHEDIESFLYNKNIVVIKKGKKGYKEKNIRPLILKLEVVSGGIFARLSQGSRENLNPDIMLNALYDYIGKEKPNYIPIERIDMYYSLNGEFISMDRAGENIT